MTESRKYLDGPGLKDIKGALDTATAEMASRQERYDDTMNAEQGMHTRKVQISVGCCNLLRLGIDSFSKGEKCCNPLVAVSLRRSGSIEYEVIGRTELQEMTTDPTFDEIFDLPPNQHIELKFDVYEGDPDVHKYPRSHLPDSENLIGTGCLRLKQLLVTPGQEVYVSLTNIDGNKDEELREKNASVWARANAYLLDPVFLKSIEDVEEEPVATGMIYSIGCERLIHLDSDKQGKPDTMIAVYSRSGKTKPWRLINTSGVALSSYSPLYDKSFDLGDSTKDPKRELKIDVYEGFSGRHRMGRKNDLPPQSSLIGTATVFMVEVVASRFNQKQRFEIRLTHPTNGLRNQRLCAADTIAYFIRDDLQAKLRQKKHRKKAMLQALSQLQIDDREETQKKESQLSRGDKHFLLNGPSGLNMTGVSRKPVINCIEFTVGCRNLVDVDYGNILVPPNAYIDIWRRDERDGGEFSCGKTEVCFNDKSPSFLKIYKIEYPSFMDPFLDIQVCHDREKDEIMERVRSVDVTESLGYVNINISDLLRDPSHRFEAVITNPENPRVHQELARAESKIWVWVETFSQRPMKSDIDGLGQFYDHVKPKGELEERVNLYMRDVRAGSPVNGFHSERKVPKVVPTTNLPPR